MKNITTMYSRKDIREILKAIKKYCINRMLKPCKGCYYDKICNIFERSPDKWKV